MEYLPRSIEAAAKERVCSFKVLFLTGARLVGKSTLPKIMRYFFTHS